MPTASAGRALLAATAASDRKTPAKMGTPHIYWKVPTSGYFKFAAENEEKTRVQFLHGRYSLERPPNPLFAETNGDVRGEYLVKVPSVAVLERKQHEAACAAANSLAVHDNLQAGLSARAEIDNLKREHARLALELRSLATAVSLNSFSREKALAAFDIATPTIVPRPRHGVSHSLQHFPCIRSKPQYTSYIKNNKGL